MSSTLPASDLAERVQRVLGAPSDSIQTIAARARQALRDRAAIVWEGDATTFQFLYVNEEAEKILGYPRERWLREPTFWSDVVVHPEERDTAVSFCALATGQGRDHDFVYRACTASGETRLLHDFVKVVKGSRGFATHLHGIMVDVTDDPEYNEA